MPSTTFLGDDEYVVVESDRNASGVGDVVFRTGGVERARIKADGTGTGWPNVIGGSVSPIANVKTLYGAIGNSVVDDTAAINAALASPSPKTVYVPDGSYRVTSPLLIPDNTIFWLSPNATILRDFTGTGSVNATVRNRDQPAGNAGISLIGGRFDIFDSGQTGKQLAFRGCSNLRLFDNWVTGLKSDWATTLTDCLDVRCLGYKQSAGNAVGEDGIHIQGGSRIVIDSFDIVSGDDAISITQEGLGNLLDATDIAIGNGRVASVVANGIKLQVKAAQTLAIRRVTITNVVGATLLNHGFYIEDLTNTGLVSDVTVAGAPFDQSGAGDVSGAWINQAVRVSMARVSMLNGPGKGFHVVGGDQVTLDDCASVIVAGSTEQNVRVDGTTNFKLRGGSYAGATTHAVALGTSVAVSDAMIEGATISGGSANGIRLVNAAGTRVVGNRITGCAQGIVEVSPSDGNTIALNDLAGQSSPLTLAGLTTRALLNKGVPAVLSSGAVADALGREAIRVGGIGLRGQNFDRAACSGTSIWTAQLVRGSLLGFQAGDVINNILFEIEAAPGTPANLTALKVAVFTATGTELGVSLDAHAQGQSVGTKSVALNAAYTVPNDEPLVVAVWMDGTSMPTLLTGKAIQSGAAIGAGVAAAVSQSGQADMPSPATFSASTTQCWFGWN